MIESHKDLNLYFYELLQEALKNKKLNPDPAVEYYLVELLGNLHKENHTQTLVDLQIKASDKPEVAKYKSLGDCALTKLGIFEDYLVYHNISLSYIETVGSRAYSKASNLAIKDKRANVFYELSSKFCKYAEILEDVKDNTSLGISDPLKLYDRYVNTKSIKALNKLNKLGLVVITTESEA